MIYTKHNQLRTKVAISYLHRMNQSFHTNIKTDLLNKSFFHTNIITDLLT